MTDKNFNWDAAAFFERLTEKNILAQENGFRFERVSSLEGFHSALGEMLTAPAFVAVSDTSQGFSTLGNTPHNRRVKTVFLAMRHAVDDEGAREECMSIMRELFRQFLSVLIQEKTQLEESRIYMDNRVDFNEINRYFFTGCACAFFQISVTTYTDISYNPEEWLS